MNDEDFADQALQLLKLADVVSGTNNYFNRVDCFELVRRVSRLNGSSVYSAKIYDFAGNGKVFAYAAGATAVEAIANLSATLRVRMPYNCVSLPSE